MGSPTTGGGMREQTQPTQARLGPALGVAAVLFAALAVSGCMLRAGFAGLEQGSTTRTTGATAPLGPAPDHVVLALDAGLKSGVPRLVTIRTDGRDLSTLATAEMIYSASPPDELVAMSPAHDRVAFVQLTDPQGTALRLCVADLKSRESTVVFTGAVESFVWDGRVLVAQVGNDAHVLRLLAIERDGRSATTTFSVPASFGGSGGFDFPRLVGADGAVTYVGEFQGGFDSVNQLKAVWRADKSSGSLVRIRDLAPTQAQPAKVPLGVVHLALPGAGGTPGMLTTILEGVADDAEKSLRVMSLAAERWRAERPS